MWLISTFQQLLAINDISNNTVCISGKVQIKNGKEFLFVSWFGIKINTKNKCLRWSLNLLSMKNMHQRWFTYWPFISCINFTWVSPRPRPFRRLEAVFSPFILTGEINVTTDYDQFFAPSSPRYILDPFFTRTVSFSEHSDTEIAFFRHINQDKINFVQDLSLSQQRTLARSGT